MEPAQSDPEPARPAQRSRLSRAVKWVIAVALFGLCPLLLLMAMASALVESGGAHPDRLLALLFLLGAGACFFSAIAIANRIDPGVASVSSGGRGGRGWRIAGWLLFAGIAWVVTASSSLALGWSGNAAFCCWALVLVAARVFSRRRGSKHDSAVAPRSGEDR